MSLSEVPQFAAAARQKASEGFKGAAVDRLADAIMAIHAHLTGSSPAASQEEVQISKNVEELMERKFAYLQQQIDQLNGIHGA